MPIWAIFEILMFGEFANLIKSLEDITKIQIMNVLCFVISVHMEDIMTIIKDGSKNLMNALILNAIVDASKKKFNEYFY